MADRDIPEEMVEKAAAALATFVCSDPDQWKWYTEHAELALSAALAGREIVDTKPDDLDPDALNAVANAVHDHYGFVRLDVRYRAAAAAVSIVEEWLTTPIPGAAGSGVGDQDG